MTYKTSLDKPAKIITIAITLLFAFIIVTQIFIIKDKLNDGALFAIIALLLIYFGTFSFRPVSYELTDDKLIIHRPPVNIKIYRGEIASVAQIDKASLSWSIRLWAVGGLFGYWGQFTNRKIGNMTWYATRKNNAVMIKTIYNRVIILTPDEPVRFVTEFGPHANAKRI